MIESPTLKVLDKVPDQSETAVKVDDRVLVKQAQGGGFQGF